MSDIPKSPETLSCTDSRDAQQLSALIDGQLQGDELDAALNLLATSPEARNDWDTYHLIGEVMRSDAAGARPYDPKFVSQLRQKLTYDDANLVAFDAIKASARGPKTANIASANDSKWLRVAGLVPLALVGLLAWQGYQFLGQNSATLASSALSPRADAASAPALVSVAAPATQLAAASTPSAGAANPLPVMIRDPQLDALLAAHRQLGGGSALQMSSGFLRNATFDEGSR